MTRVLQLRRGSTVQNDNFTGLPGEITMIQIPKQYEFTTAKRWADSQSHARMILNNNLCSI